MEEITTNNDNVLLPIAATSVEMRRDAARFPRIGTMDRRDAIEQMVAVVRDACVYFGAKKEATDIASTATVLVDEMRIDNHYGLKYISFAEIRRAVRNACLFSDMYGVSVRTLYRAITEYAKGEGTQAAREVATTARQSAPQVAIDAAAAALVKQHTNR